MSCRRLRRELVDLFRFGGLDVRSAPHLEHLAACRDCRDEVGIDRVLVQRLRSALAERIAGSAPAPSTWDAILARAQAPERGLRGWLRDHAMVLAARLRAATAAAAMALAVVIAVGTDVGIHQTEPASMPATDRMAEAFEAGPARPIASSALSASAGEPTVLGPGVRPTAGPELSVRGEILYVETAQPEPQAPAQEPELYFHVRPAAPAARAADAGSAGDVDGEIDEPPSDTAETTTTRSNRGGQAR